MYHLHISYDNTVNETFYTLKLAPTLLLGKGFRLSSVLIYNSKIEAYGQHAHLYASVKINKDLGKRCNVFAGVPPPAMLLMRLQRFLISLFLLANRLLKRGIYEDLTRATVPYFCL